MLPVLCVKWSFNSLFFHILKIESLFLASSLGLSLFSILSALARHWSFAGVPFVSFFRFQIRVFFSPSFSFFSLSRKVAKLATGFDLSPSEKMYRRKVVHSPTRPRCLGFVCLCTLEFLFFKFLFLRLDSKIE